MGTDDRALESEVVELKTFGLDSFDTAADFWTLFSQCVDVVYTTEPPERIGLVRTAMIDRFGPINSPTWERVENTVLRIVSWMCEFEDR